MRQLSGQDATFLYLESPGAHLHLTALYVYQQPRKPHRPLRFADIRRQITARLSRSDLFGQKLVRPPLDLDYPYWVDDPDFDPNDHLLRYVGPVPASRRQLFAAVAELHALPLDLSRPPWQMHLLEKLGPIEGLPPRCFAVIARYHHAAIDGASGTQLVDSLHQSSPSELASAAAAVLPPRDPGAARVPGTAELLARAAVNNISGQIKLGRAIITALPAICTPLVGKLLGQRRDAATAAADAGKAPVPATRFNRPVSTRRVFHAFSVSLDDIRQLRTGVHGATINDVVLAITAGGLRAWLLSLQELPDDSLVAMIPVNARSTDEAALGGNRLSMHFLPIHSDIPGALDRLRAIQRTTHSAKSPAGGLSPQQSSDISAHVAALPLAAAARLITGLGLNHRLLKVCNCTITNVPGARKAQYLGPARLVFSTGSGPVIDGMGLIITAFTSQDRLTFSYTSCPEMLPDPERLADYCQQAFEQLQLEVAAAGG